MLPRLIEPQKGQININNINIKKINIYELRNIVSYIDQKPIFIRGSVLDHISYNNRISKKECISIAEWKYNSIE